MASTLLYFPVSLELWVPISRVDVPRGLAFVMVGGNSVKPMNPFPSLCTLCWLCTQVETPSELS